MPMAPVYGGPPRPMRQMGAQRPLGMTSFRPAAPPLGGGGVQRGGRMAAPMGGFSTLQALGSGRLQPSQIPGLPAPAPVTPWNPADPLAGANNLQDPIRAWIAQGGREGAFGPDYLAKQMRSRAMRNADAGKRRTAVLARLMGLDPMQQRGAMVDADISANQSTVDALNDAELGGIGEYQGWLKELLGRERYGVESPGEAANIDRRFQESQSKRDFWGGLAGSVVGAGAGALTGRGR